MKSNKATTRFGAAATVLALLFSLLVPVQLLAEGEAPPPETSPAQSLPGEGSAPETAPSQPEPGAGSGSEASQPPESSTSSQPTQSEAASSNAAVSEAAASEAPASEAASAEAASEAPASPAEAPPAPTPPEEPPAEAPALPASEEGPDEPGLATQEGPRTTPATLHITSATGEYGLEWYLEVLSSNDERDNPRYIAGDTFVIDNNITLTTTPEIKKPITIKAEGSAKTITSAAAGGRHFITAVGNGNQVAFENLVFKGAKASEAALVAAGGNPDEVLASTPGGQYGGIDSGNIFGGGEPFVSVLSFVNCEFRGNMNLGAGNGNISAGALQTGSATLVGCTLAGNLAVQPNAGGADGGAISTEMYSTVNLLLDNCLLQNNHAISRNYGGDAMGGALWGYGPGILLRNTAVKDNSARIYEGAGANSGSSSGAAGGGIFIYNNFPLTIEGEGSVISGNKALGGECPEISDYGRSGYAMGGGISVGINKGGTSNGGHLTLRNGVLVENNQAIAGKSFHNSGSVKGGGVRSGRLTVPGEDGDAEVIVRNNLAQAQTGLDGAGDCGGGGIYLSSQSGLYSQAKKLRVEGNVLEVIPQQAGQRSKTGGHYLNGGGIYSDGKTILEDCTIANNAVRSNGTMSDSSNALSGGALYFSGSIGGEAHLLKGCSITGNRLEGGAGTTSDEGNGNVVLLGAGVALNTDPEYGRLEMEDCLVASNHIVAGGTVSRLEAYGAGVAGNNNNSYCNNTTLLGCTVQGNSITAATWDSVNAGISNRHSSLTGAGVSHANLYNCTIVENSIHMPQAASGNYVLARGAGAYQYSGKYSDGKLKAAFNTFTGNTIKVPSDESIFSYGAGLYVLSAYSGGLTEEGQLVGNLIAGNTAKQGDDPATPSEAIVGLQDDYAFFTTINNLAQGYTKHVDFPQPILDGAPAGTPGTNYNLFGYSGSSAKALAPLLHAETGPEGLPVGKAEASGNHSIVLPGSRAAGATPYETPLSFAWITGTAGTRTLTEDQLGQPRGSQASIGAVQGGASASAVALTAPSATLGAGGQMQLALSFTPAHAGQLPVSYGSSNTAVAVVSANGLVTAKQPGSTTLSVSAGGLSDSLSLTVTQGVAAKGVALNRETAYLWPGEELQLTATVLPENASNPFVDWASSDPTVVSVSPSGHLKAHMAGSSSAASATITATSRDGAHTATCTVGVMRESDPRGLALSETVLYLNKRQTATLKGSSLRGGGGYNMTWKSSQTQVATVYANRNDNTEATVTAGSNTGEAIITYTSSHANLLGMAATCRVVVVDETYIPVTGVSISPTTHTMNVGASTSFSCTVAPGNASIKAVSWGSSNEQVASVSASGSVTAIAAGTTNITVTTDDGSFTATAALTVTGGAGEAVTGVAVTPGEATLAPGGTKQLSATVAPAGAANKTVSWGSSNNSIATVSASGLVTAVAEGTATITATTSDGGFTDACTITVQKAADPEDPGDSGNSGSSGSSNTPGNPGNPGTPADPAPPTNPATPSAPVTSDPPARPGMPEGPVVTQVAFPQKSIVLRQGTSASLPACAYTETGNAPVSYSSSRPELATVSQSGKITAGKAKTGTARITAEAGGKKATLSVKVVPKSAKAVKVKSISAKLPKTMKVGQVRQVSAKHSPAAAHNVRFTFSSSKKAVASIDKYGHLTAHKKGSTTITIKGGGISRTYTVTVR